MWFILFLTIYIFGSFYLPLVPTFSIPWSWSVVSVWSRSGSRTRSLFLVFASVFLSTHTFGSTYTPTPWSTHSSYNAYILTFRKHALVHFLGHKMAALSNQYIFTSLPSHFPYSKRRDFTVFVHLKIFPESWWKLESLSFFVKFNVKYIFLYLIVLCYRFSLWKLKLKWRRFFTTHSSSLETTPVL